MINAACRLGTPTLISREMTMHRSNNMAGTLGAGLGRVLNVHPGWRLVRHGG